MLLLLKVLTLALTAIILVPSGAHLFELPGKIGLSRDAYFTVQGIYAGWALFGLPIIGAILANGALYVALRRRVPQAARWALTSAALITRPIRRRQTGRLSPTTGKLSGGFGSTPMPPAP